MIGKWRRWNSHLGQIGKRGDHSWLAAKGSWCDIVLHCIAISYLRKSQVKLTRVAKFGLKNNFLRMAALTQSKRFFDYYLRAWRLIGTCQREKILTIWCWRLFLSETCIGFTMHNVTAPALHVKCLSCTLSRSALGASLCIDVFLLQKSISAKQYLGVNKKLCENLVN